MNYTEIITIIFEVIILPFLGIVAKYFVQWLDAKAQEIKAKTSNDIEKKYIDYINDTIADCVMATTQTYVETLKNENKFDKEAQQEAFKMTLNAILSVLGEDAIKYINEVNGDLIAYLTLKIEAMVKLQK